MARLNLLYFAWVREAIGMDGEEIDHPGAGVSVGALVDELRRRGGGYERAFANPERLRAALDQRFVPLTEAVGEAKELALFPPVTGG